MQLEAIRLSYFRNYQDVSLSFPEGVTILAGENAQGKTNLLEAIFLLTGGRSWRAGKRGDLISFHQSQAQIQAKVFSRQREFRMDLTLPRTGKLQSIVNGVKQQRQSDLSEVFRCVLFSPEDLYLIREGPAARRRFLDTALCQLRPRYALALGEYNKLLEHKAKILRMQEENPSLLAVLPDFTRRMAKCGAAVIRYRAFFAEKLAREAYQIQQTISGCGEELLAEYQTVSTVKDPKASEETIEGWLLEHAESHEKAELAAGQCLTGPHKDDLLLTVNGSAARGFASQGQTRTAALALKFAEREIFKDDQGEYPVMLLDDVLSELDSRRQEYLIGKTGGGQVIITCCERTQRLRQLQGAAFLVEGGTIAPLNQ